MTKKEPLLQVQRIKKYYPIRSGILKRTKAHLRAVDGVSFDLRNGEIFGLVGESGCGKSTLSRVVIRLEEPTSGRIVFKGKELNNLKNGELRTLRSEMQMVFQDPLASLNPRMTIEKIIERPLRIYKLYSRNETRKFSVQLLERVGLHERHLLCYPHELSGGQQQRVGIARALGLSPSLLILDEPTSSLDVSIQSQIVNLLMELQAEYEMSFLLVSHDLSLVRFMSDRIGVMYLGRIVELGSKEEIFGNMQHPYTKSLFSAIPRIEFERRSIKKIILQGTIPSLFNIPEGCRFSSRCPFVHERCNSEPQLKLIQNNHYVACHLINGGMEDELYNESVCVDMKGV